MYRDIKYMYFCVFLRCKTCSVATASRICMWPPICVSQNNGSKPVWTTAAALTLVMLSGKGTLCAHVLAHIFHLTSVKPGLYVGWSKWFIVLESTCTSSPLLGKKCNWSSAEQPWACVVHVGLNWNIETKITDALFN